MDWVRSYVALGHRMFIQFIELKIEGPWHPYAHLVVKGEEKEVVLEAKNAETCRVHLIEPDGLRRIFHFTLGATINIHQNILSYHPEQADEIAVDEKEQAGKGKTRDKL